MAAPKLHAKLRTMMRRLCNNKPGLRRPFSNSIFPACTVNFGPRAITVPHLDHFNDPALMCFINSLGDFDPKLGGHLVLWDLKLVIEFPPGSVIGIPSSLLRHSNLPIQPGERRASFTQYAAGGLFRWVDHGFNTLERCDPELRKALSAENVNRFERGLGLFTTLDEFLISVKRKGGPL
jgi:hypothetical protein